MSEVSTFRLYVLRAAYLLIAVGLGIEIWPQILDHPMTMHGAASSLLGGISLLAVLGLRYPLKMLPLLLFELVWKSIFLLAVALPLWRAHRMDADAWANTQACLMGAIFLFVIPWRYGLANYVLAPGDRWWGKSRAYQTQRMAV